jgi:signal transduction histidine kinase/ActR/RegA family two-component response regulator
MSEESAERFREADRLRLSQTGRLDNVEYRIVTRDGDPLDVLLSARIEHDDDTGRVLSTGGIVDVTARRRAEEALLQSQKMEAIGKLTGGVAHDFNNLLSVVLGSLKLLRKRVPQEAPLLRLIDNAVEGAERGTILTQRMLAFARKQSLTPVAIDVPELVRGMADLLRRSLGPHIQIGTQFPIELPRVKADPNQLELALLNLAVNARDAMPGGGKITIGARETSSQDDHDNNLAPGDYVWLFMTDTGLGMDEETLARARDPFFTTKPVGKGTGLGLAMVHGFAAQSGGTLVLRSRKGRGTTAEIWLPVALRAVSPSLGKPENAHRLPKPSAPTTILAVDDDALVLMNTVAMLEELGHKPIEATSAERALDLLATHDEIRLVITDQAMPGMTGVQLAQAIRAERPNVPIVVATGYSEIPDAEALGLAIIGKPFNEESLAHVIAATLRDGETGRVVPFHSRDR